MCVCFKSIYTYLVALMVKVWISIFLALSLILSVTACSKKDMLDVNRDGKIDFKDAAQMGKNLADVDGDGDIDSEDLVAAIHLYKRLKSGDFSGILEALDILEHTDVIGDTSAGTNTSAY